jgi:hypothetical protein
MAAMVGIFFVPLSKKVGRFYLGLGGGMKRFRLLTSDEL